MEGTPVSGTYSQLFEGDLENVIKCLNVNYESSRSETFNCLQLSIGGDDCSTIEDSLKKYVSSEILDGDNQYESELFGK